MSFSIPLPKLSLQRVASLSILLALDLTITRLTTITLIPYQLVFSLRFLVDTVIGMIGGPVWTFVTLGLFDIIDTLTSGGGSFIIWYLLVEAVQGFFYGLFFYGKRLNASNTRHWLYVSIATIVIMGIGTFTLTPLLTQIYFHTPIVAQYASGRWLKIFEIPIRICLTMLAIPRLQTIPELRKLANL